MKLKNYIPINEASLKLYRIEEYDEDGRNIRRYMGIFKSNSPDNARKLAATYYKNKEIVTTGFYGAKEITKQQIQKELKELQDEIEARTKIITVNPKPLNYDVPGQGRKYDEPGHGW